MGLLFPGGAPSALSSALTRRALVHFLAAPGAALLTAPRHLVDRRPRAALGLLRGCALLPVTLLDVLRLPLLLGGVARFVSLRHVRVLGCLGYRSSCALRDAHTRPTSSNRRTRAPGPEPYGPRRAPCF